MWGGSLVTGRGSVGGGGRAYVVCQAGGGIGVLSHCLEARGGLRDSSQGLKWRRVGCRPQEEARRRPGGGARPVSSGSGAQAGGARSQTRASRGRTRRRAGGQRRAHGEDERREQSRKVSEGKLK